MLPSPYGCRLGPREYYFSRPQRVHCCYGPVTRNLPWEGLVDRLRRFCFHLLRYPNYGAPTSTPAGLSPAEHASLHWTHNHPARLPAASVSQGLASGKLVSGLFSSTPRERVWKTCQPPCDGGWRFPRRPKTLARS